MKGSRLRLLSSEYLFKIEKTMPESTPPLKEVEIFVSETSLIRVES